MDSHTKFTAISLCTGIGFLDRGLNIALGGKLRTILYSEREAFACANLAWQMEEKFLDEAAEWSNVKTITSAECRDYVREALGGRRLDFIHGGIPCQPYSGAGKRRGGDDERDLWPTTLEAIKVYQPRFVFIENVGGMASHVDGARRLLSDLEGAGYRAKAGLFTSKECGANHLRPRWFFFGIADRSGCERTDVSLRARRQNKTGFESVRRSGKLADASKSRREERQGEQGNTGEKCTAIERSSLQLADAERREQHQRRRESADVAGWDGDRKDELARYAPARNDFGAWEIVEEVDAARMPAIESTLRGVATWLTNWDLQLYCIGNSVDPLVAAYAFCTLWACMQED